MSLTAKAIQQAAAEIADTLPGTSSGHPFTEHLRVWKVAGRVFLIVTEHDPELEIITVKVDPHRGDALRRDHAAISRGHYLDKEHWISIAAGTGLTRALVENLVHGSYELAARQAPAKDRPEHEAWTRPSPGGREGKASR